MTETCIDLLHSDQCFVSPIVLKRITTIRLQCDNQSKRPNIVCTVNYCKYLNSTGQLRGKSSKLVSKAIVLGDIISNPTGDIS